MVRVKKVVDSEKQAELKNVIDCLKDKFKGDKRELEEAKRKFSSAYVDEVVKQLEAAISQNILNMRATDFAKLLSKFGAEDQYTNSNMHTPVQSRRKFKSITTPSGVAVQIPSLITPRVDGAVLRSRTSRHGEVLFSVNGTPVTIDDAPRINSVEQAKTVQELLRKDESEMSPATQKIMQQLRAVIAKKAAATPSLANDENQLMHTSDTSEDN